MESAVEAAEWLPLGVPCLSDSAVLGSTIKLHVAVLLAVTERGATIAAWQEIHSCTATLSAIASEGPALCLLKVPQAAEPCPPACSPMTRVYRVLRAAYQARWRKWRAGKQRPAHTSGYTGAQGAHMLLADRTATAEDLHSWAPPLGCAHSRMRRSEAELDAGCKGKGKGGLVAHGMWHSAFWTSQNLATRIGASGAPPAGQRKPHATDGAACCLVRNAYSSGARPPPAGLLADVDCLRLLHMASECPLLHGCSAAWCCRACQSSA